MARFTQLAGFTTGRTTVTLSGTPAQLSTASTVIPAGVKLVIKAMGSNTGTIHVGNSSANALNTGTTSFRLTQNQSIELEIDNLTRVWLDTTVDGEGVEYLFER